MNLAIVGPGLIGHSIALAVRQAWCDASVVELDTGDALTPVAGADTVVLATPVHVILSLIRDHRDILRDRVIVDTGSTKRAIMRAAREAALHGFVGGHPLAGATSSGPAAARADLFEGRTWFLVPHGARSDAVTRVQGFVEGIGALPVVMHDDGSEHDRVMAAVSHLPQVVASTLINVVAEAVGDRLSWAGAGLRDTTRLAESSASMWESILATNAAEVRPVLLTLAEQLTTIATQLENPGAIRALFAQAHRARRLL